MYDVNRDKKIADKFTKSRFYNCACKNNTPQKSSNGARAQRMKTISSHLLKYVLFVARAFSYFLFARAYIIVLYSADVGHILYINGYYFIFLAYNNVCSVTELT